MSVGPEWVDSDSEVDVPPTRRTMMKATHTLRVLALAAVMVTGSAGVAAASGGVSGGGGGGGTPTTTVAPTTSCAVVSSFSNSTGYYSVWAAIWTKFSISNSCSAPANWQMTYTNGTTGLVDFARGSSTQYMSSGTIDEDWADFSTAYTVTLTVTDASGVVLDSRSAVVTTKQPKTPGA